MIAHGAELGPTLPVQHDPVASIIHLAGKKRKIIAAVLQLGMMSPLLIPENSRCVFYLQVIAPRKSNSNAELPLVDEPRAQIKSERIRFAANHCLHSNGRGIQIKLAGQQAIPQ